MTKLPIYNGKYTVDMNCWTISFAKTINEQINPSDRYPIFVPSYNRYNDNAIFISIMRDYSTWPVFVIVRKSQYDDYVKAYNCSHITIIPIDDNKITDAGMAHAACINVSESDNLFVISLKSLFRSTNFCSKFMCSIFANSYFSFVFSIFSILFSNSITPCPLHLMSSSLKFS